MAVPELKLLFWCLYAQIRPKMRGVEDGLHGGPNRWHVECTDQERM